MLRRGRELFEIAQVPERPPGGHEQKPGPRATWGVFGGGPGPHQTTNRRMRHPGWRSWRDQHYRAGRSQVL